MIEEIEKRNNKKTHQILDTLNKYLGAELPNLHKSPMISQKFGMKLLNIKRGVIEVEFKVSSEMVNPLGFLHGGMQCTLMDDIIGIAVATMGYDNFTISNSLNVHYLSKGKLNDIIRVKAEIIKEGRLIIHACSSITKTEGKLIAIANSDLIRTNLNSEHIKI